VPAWTPTQADRPPRPVSIIGDPRTPRPQTIDTPRYGGSFSSPVRFFHPQFSAAFGLRTLSLGAAPLPPERDTVTRGLSQEFLESSRLRTAGVLPFVGKIGSELRTADYGILSGNKSFARPVSSPR